MEPEASLPCSQEPAYGPFPEPDESSPQLPTLFLLRSTHIMFSSKASYSELSLPFIFRLKFCVHYSTPKTIFKIECYETMSTLLWHFV